MFQTREGQLASHDNEHRLYTPEMRHKMKASDLAVVVEAV